MNATEIKKLRESLGLTTTEFAVKLGVSQAAVNKWEAGIGRPNGSAQILLRQLEEQAKQLAAK